MLKSCIIKKECFANEEKISHLKTEEHKKYLEGNIYYNIFNDLFSWNLLAILYILGTVLETREINDEQTEPVSTSLHPIV